MYYKIRKGIFSKPLYLRAVDGVSLDLDRGDTLALIGESGCGKTTLGMTALRLLEPLGGKITFYVRDGDELLEEHPALKDFVVSSEGEVYCIDITHIPLKELKWFRRRAQMIFQDPYSCLDPMHTIYHTLEEPLLVHGIGDREERYERVCKALEMVKLTPTEDFIPKYPHMLSGGQMQRVNIARALILGPEFIIADEPVTMLDASVRVEILMLLRELQKREDIAFVYITHDMSTAKYFSHKAAIMYAGKIVETGDFMRIVNEPTHPYTQALIEVIPEPDPKNRFRERNVPPGEPPRLVNPPPGCRFAPRCPYAKDICRKEEPPFTEIKPGHSVACWLHV